MMVLSHNMIDATPFLENQARLLSAKACNNAKSKPLGEDFVLGEFDVLCTRGKQANSHSGNKYFRAIVESYRTQYANVRSKLERTLIVSEIVDLIRSKGNGFVKPDKNTGVWTEVGDLVAREKVGQLFRNVLSDQYKSSRTNKRLRRKCATTKLAENLHRVIASNSGVTQHMAELVQETEQSTSDDALMVTFAQKNLQMLQLIKNDQALLPMYNDAVAAAESSDDETIIAPEITTSLE